MENKITIKTNLLCHEYQLNWEIQNVLKTSKILYGEKFSFSQRCKKKIRSALKIVKSSYNVYTLYLGVQRVDRSKEDITIITNLQLCKSDKDIYVSRTAKFKCRKDVKIHWCISGKFSDPLQKQSQSRQSDVDVLSSTTKSLSSSETDAEDIFPLRKDVLVVNGIIKIYGCCVNSKLSTSKSSKSDESTKDDLVHDSVYETINDFKLACEPNFFADVSLKVDGFFIRTHKFVLSSRCPYFRKILFGGNIDVIDITDMKKHVLESFLRFLYTGTIGCVRWDTIRELYSVADKYEVDLLKKNCSRMMKLHVKHKNASDVLILAHNHQDDDLKSYALHFMVDNFENNSIINGYASIRKDYPELASTILNIRNFKKKLYT